MQATRKLQASEAVVHADLDGEAVLLNVESGVYFGLDAVGADIWKRLEQGASEGEIVAALLAEYDVDPARVQQDVGVFLDLLIEKGLAHQADLPNGEPSQEPVHEQADGSKRVPSR